MSKKDVGKVGAKTNFPLVDNFFSGEFLRGSAVFGKDYPHSMGFEPQRRNNGFLFAPLQEIKAALSIPPAVPGSLMLALKSVELPKDENEIIELGYFNQKRFFAGQHRTQEITLTFIDYVDTPIMHVLEAWRSYVYNPGMGAVGWAGGSPKSIVSSGVPIVGALSGYKQDVYLMTLSPNANWIYTKVFRLAGAFPSALDRGDIDFDDDGVSEISITLHYDEVYFILHGYLPEIALYYSPFAAGTDVIGAISGEANLFKINLPVPI